MQAKTAIATAYGQDVNDIEYYQYGRWKPAIFQVGDKLICFTKTELPPKHEGQWSWSRSQEWFTKLYSGFIWEAIT